MNKISEYLFNNFIDDLSLLKKIKKEKYLDYFYDEIKKHMNKKHKLLSKTNKKISNIKDFNSTELLMSNFSNKDAIRYIDENVKSYSVYVIKIGEIKVTINYLHFDNKTNISKLNYVLGMLSLLLSYSNLKIKSLIVNLYLTKVYKTLPDNPVITLSQNNCNSAVTYSCSEYGELLVFREEEWFKVMIHELCHSLCLDFSRMKVENSKINRNLNKLFGIKLNMNVSEMYCEYWATILNSCFKGYKLLDNKEDIKNFRLYSNICINLEKLYSVYQLVKILDYMGLRYEDLILKNRINKTLYKESTNVFCYYILKSVLLYNSNEFIEWCLKHNTLLLNIDKSPTTIHSLFLFILSNYKKVKYLNLVNNVEKVLKRDKINLDNSNMYKYKNLRMTMIELN
tara:strand:- start:986 stop:2176 length:1191 start_codon:yes stop_codon:yes gene_type:complete